jgi:hypothetical protein
MNFSDNKVWRFYAEKNIANQSVDVFWMAQGVQGKSYRRAFPQVEQVEYEEGIAHPQEPTFRLDYEEAQTLMQELWNTGLRPDGVEGTVEHVAALKVHLAAQSEVLQHFMMMQKNPQITIMDNDMQEQLDELKKVLVGLTDDHPF